MIEGVGIFLVASCYSNWRSAHAIWAMTRKPESRRLYHKACRNEVGFKSLKHTINAITFYENIVSSLPETRILAYRMDQWYFLQQCPAVLAYITSMCRDI